MTSTLIKTAIVAAALSACSVLNAGIVLQDTFTTLDTNQWTVTNNTNTSAYVQNGQLNLSYNAGAWGAGSSIASNTFTFDGSPLEFTFQKISYTHYPAETDFNLYHTYRIGLATKAFVLYQHSKDKEVVQFYLDGAKVYDSSVWPAEGIIANNSYYGFRLTATGWELLRSADGITYTAYKTGTLAINLNFSDQVKILNGNAHGYGNDLVLDNVTLSTIPEAASAGLLGLGALTLLSRHAKRSNAL